MANTFIDLVDYATSSTKIFKDITTTVYALYITVNIFIKNKENLVCDCWNCRNFINNGTESYSLQIFNIYNLVFFCLCYNFIIYRSFTIIYLHHSCYGNLRCKFEKMIKITFLGIRFILK